MATAAIEKDFVTIRISKKIAAAAIKNLENYAWFLEIKKDAPKKVPTKKITELADEVTATAWKKFKNQHRLQVQ